MKRKSESMWENSSIKVADLIHFFSLQNTFSIMQLRIFQCSKYYTFHSLFTARYTLKNHQIWPKNVKTLLKHSFSSRKNGKYFLNTKCR